MASRELSILVTAKNLASKVLGQVKGDVKGIESVGKKASANLSRNVGLGVAAVGAGLAVQVKAGVDSLVELERVNNLTAAALESTGNAAGQSVKGIRARSEELERMTGVDDKVLQNAQNLLLTFPEIEEKAFEPTLEAAVNLNAALGGGDEGLQGVLLQVAKAVNDPIRGMTALRRSGVSFTKEQQDQVKEMVEANDMMGAQAIVLGELEKQFGGAAEAANKGVGGAQKRFADAIEDMQMALAQGFLPLIERVSDTMGRLVADPAFMAGVEAFGETLASGFEEALNFAESVDWGAVGDALLAAGSGARMAMDAFLGAPAWLQTAILTGWGLNKVTGGALGSLVGMIGQGIIKGVMNMNAGVVNIKAGAVTGGGGTPVPAGKGGGLLGGIATVTIAGGALALLTEIATGVNKEFNPTGFTFNELAGTKGVTRVQVEGDLLDLSAQTGRSVTNLQAEMIPLLQDGNNTWQEVVNLVSDGNHGTDRTTAATERAEAAIRDAIPWHQRNVAEIHALNASEANRHAVRQATANAQLARQAEALAAARGGNATLANIQGIEGGNAGRLERIASKPPATVNVSVTPVNYISVNNWTRVQNSAQVAYSTLSAGI